MILLQFLSSRDLQEPQAVWLTCTYWRFRRRGCINFSLSRQGSDSSLRLLNNSYKGKR
jgi:hypothetical protein